MPAVIPYITYDTTKPNFSAPETPYSFHFPSHTFSGENAAISTSTGMTGLCSLVVRFNYAGELEHGSVKVVGGIPSLGIPKGSLLLLGKVVNVDAFAQGGIFQANFFFRIEQDHHALGYTSHFGVWNTYMAISGWPPANLPLLFQKTWGPAFVALNSYIGQVGKIV